MEAQVGKWGNSLAVRLPKGLAEEVGLTEGSRLDLLVDKGRIVIKPRKAPAYTLEELVAGIKPSNRHAEASWGSPQGGEAW